INGVIIDLVGAPETAWGIFSFPVEVGDGTTWSPAPWPVSVTSRRGAGVLGSERLTLRFADGAIKNTWLRVTVPALPYTGLSSPDVFYFGNLVGDGADPAS